MRNITRENDHVNTRDPDILSGTMLWRFTALGELLTKRCKLSFRITFNTFIYFSDSRGNHKGSGYIDV